MPTLLESFKDWNRVQSNIDKVEMGELYEYINSSNHDVWKMISHPLFNKYVVNIFKEEVNLRIPENLRHVESRVQQFCQTVEEIYRLEPKHYHPIIFSVSYMKSLWGIARAMDLDWNKMNRDPVFVLAGAYTPESITGFNSMIKCGIPGMYNGIPKATVIPFDINGRDTARIGKNYNFINANVDSLPFRKSSVDLVFTNELFEVLPSYEMADFLTELRRVTIHSRMLIGIENIIFQDIAGVNASPALSVSSADKSLILLNQGAKGITKTDIVKSQKHTTIIL